MTKSLKRHNEDAPSLTIAGKRDIIKLAQKKLGEKAFLSWLNQQGIPSYRHIYEHVRKYKAKLFRDMMDLVG